MIETVRNRMEAAMNILSSVDELARRLAAEAGLVWEQFSDHPGYQKYLWREQAAVILAASFTPQQ